MGHNNKCSLYTNNCAFDSTLYFVYSSGFPVILASCAVLDSVLGVLGARWCSCLSPVARRRHQRRDPFQSDLVLFGETRQREAVQVEYADCHCFVV